MAGRPKINKKGGLSHEEKGRIIYLLQTLGDHPDNYEKIAEDLDRPISSVKKTIKEIKSIFVSTEQDTNLNIKTGLIERVRLNLIQAGVNKLNAMTRINKILSKLSAEEQIQLTEEELFKSCLRLTTPNDLIINESASGRSGVTIMTPASSERADNNMRNTPPQIPGTFKLF